MRIRATSLIALCLAVSLSGQTPPARDAQPPQPAGTASLAGVAQIEISGQPAPIRRARVTIRADDGAARTTDTDTLGKFRIDQLKAGSYRIVIDKPGFVPIGRDTIVDVPDGQVVTSNVMMQRGAAIEGRLLTADGDPVIGLTISADRLGYGPYGKKPVAIRQTTTDDLGRFRLHTLPPGEYYVEAAPDPFTTTPGPGNKPAKTYYAGVARLSDARPIVLTAEQQMNNVTFTVTTALLASLSGTIAASTGKPFDAFSVRMQRVGGPTGEVRCLIPPVRPGEPQPFTCPLAPPGDYRLLVTTRTGNADVEFGVLPVSVAGRDMTNLRIATSPGVAVAGRVEVEGGGAPPPNVQIAALETEYEYPGPSLGSAIPSVAPVSIAADGAFRFPSVAGPRVIRAQRLPEDWALKTVTLDGADISDTGTTFAASDRPQNLVVVLTTRTGSVAGTVSAGDRQPARDVRVVVFADDVGAWRTRSRMIKTALTGAGGRYSVTGLLPGKYQIAFVDRLEEGAWEDPDVLASLRSASAPVTIAAGTRATVDGRIR